MSHIGGRPLEELRRAELEGVREGLAESLRPTSTLTLPRLTAESIGGLLMFFECATAIAGGLFGIDPYNQPGVELGKRYAHGLLGRDKESHYADQFRKAVEGREKATISF
jgi:glucose-6-phosphate isomerase